MPEKGTIPLGAFDPHSEWMILPSGYVTIAIENGPFIVDLPIENGDFP